MTTLDLTRRELLTVHQALIELEIIAERSGLDARANEVRKLRFKVYRRYWKLPKGYRLAQNVTVNHGWYWRPDDKFSFCPMRVFPTRNEAIENLHQFLEAQSA